MAANLLGVVGVIKVLTRQVFGVQFRTKCYQPHTSKMTNSIVNVVQKLNVELNRLRQRDIRIVT